MPFCVEFLIVETGSFVEEGICFNDPEYIPLTIKKRGSYNEKINYWYYSFVCTFGITLIFFQYQHIVFVSQCNRMVYQVHSALDNPVLGHQIGSIFKTQIKMSLRALS